VLSHLLAHDPAGNLADPVLDPPAVVGALVHGMLMGLAKEGRRISGTGQPLQLPYTGKVTVVLARPVEVYAAGSTVPFFVGRLGATLRAFHDPPLSRQAPPLTGPTGAAIIAAAYSR